MKKLILLMVGLALAAPSSALAIQEFKRTGEIQTDESGGYSESQRDHHKKRSKQIKDKTGSGYRDGHYCGTGEKYKKGEWQFVDQSKCGGGGKSSPKSYKKVKETDAKKKDAQRPTTKKKAATKETKATEKAGTKETKATKKVADEE